MAIGYRVFEPSGKLAIFTADSQRDLWERLYTA